MVDKARAAKDGNEYHETWAARRSLELLMPRDGLTAIAIEGFSVEDEQHVSAAASEIADLVLYYGQGCTFADAQRVEISQFKYSVAQASKGFVAADARKTLRKFVAAEEDHQRRFGRGTTEKKLRFSIVTNRPIARAFALAVSTLASGEVSAEPKVIDQAHQIFAACQLEPASLQSFLARLELRGATGSLSAVKADMATRVVDWSASSDHIAQSRLGSLRALLRTKAGTEGEGRNIIRLVDVLSALGVADDRDLLPAPAAFVEIGPVVSRGEVEEQLLGTLGKGRPVLIHAAGGVGKTVFMQALAARLSQRGEAVLFDCFGGGNYRSVEDSRHLANRGLLQIVNAFAARGLCDPIIPGPVTDPDLLSTARRRFRQALATLRRQDKLARLYVLLDAADNSAQQAIDQHERAFPTLLMETFSQLGMPEGMDLIASCRTERIEITVGAASPALFPLKPFSRDESAAFLSSPVLGVTEAEIDIAQVRSQGNPRVLAHLVQEWDSLVRNRPAGSDAAIQVDQLIEMRLERALGYVSKQGLAQQAGTLLCGLTVLPPPVPVVEYANAMGLPAAAIESFAADLAPLLDRTFLGIVFRDEPTEMFVRGRYGSDENLLNALVQRLTAAQGTSVFAARALPRLLNMTDASEAALDLAFSDQLPAVLTSDLGKRAIRTHRLTTALAMASRQQRQPEAIRLLVELASVAANGDRLDALIASHPDLVACVGDAEALRRLAELRTDWPGARHARLALAYLLMKNVEEASLHAERGRQWLRWYLEQDQEDRKITAPTPLEVAAWSIQQASRGEFGRAVGALRVWRPWFGFLVAREFVRVSIDHLRVTPSDFAQKVLETTPMGPAVYAACIEDLPGLGRTQRLALIGKLAHACRATKSERPSFHDERFALENALLLAAAAALRLRARSHARAILSNVHIARPSFHSFQQPYPAERVSHWLVHTTLLCAVRGRLPSLVDIMPREARECLPPVLRRSYTKEEILERMQARARQRAKEDAARGRSGRHDGYENGRSLAEHVAPLLAVCVSFIDALTGASAGGAAELLEVLAEPVQPQFRLSEATISLRRATAREMSLMVLQLGRADTRALAGRFASAISGAFDVFLPAAVECLEVLCRGTATADVAPELLPWLDRLLEREDDASRKGDLLAGIARVLWPVSTEDSRHYFRRSMQQLHSLGSADYEIVHDLLPLAAELKSRGLAAPHWQRLANLCEMNFGGEPGKFPWVEFAAAATAAQGLQALAQLGRWCSREAVNYDYAAPPVIVELVRKRKLGVDAALALLTLDEVAEAHWFSWGDVAAALLDAAPQRAEEVASGLVGMLERDEPATTSSYSHRRLLEVLEKRLAPGSRTLSYLAERIAALQSLPEPASPSARGASLTAQSDTLQRHRAGDASRLIATTSRACAPLDAAAVAAALKAIANADRAWAARRQFVEQLAGRVAFGDRSRFLEMLVCVEELELDLRLEVLEATLDAWEGTSPSMSGRRQAIFERLLVLHASELAEETWRFRGTFERIAKVGGMSNARAAMILAGNLTQMPVAAHATHWLKLATYIAHDGDGQAAQAALTRLLSGPALSMAADFGDGEYQAGFHAGDTEECVVAGLLWTRLGSPDAFDRWRAAHTVRQLIAQGRFEIVDVLVPLFRGGSGGAFLAPAVKFHVWDARLWFLVAVGRAARDDVQVVRKYSAFLLEEAFKRDTPHALLQSFAMAALRCAPTDLAQSLDLEQLLRCHDPEVGPRTKYPRTSSDPYRPAGHPKEDHGFALDYDFRKHETPLLGRMFGLPAWEVASMLEEEAANLDPACSGMYDDGGGQRRRSRSSADGRFRSYGAHLGWHALFVLAGRLFKVRAVAQASDGGDDPWQQFLRRHGLTRSDGLWLSDGTDPYPLAAHCLLRTRAEDGEGIVEEPWTLLELAGIQDDRALAALVVQGSWESRDGVDIHVSSAFVQREKAVAACRRLARHAAYDVWLPREEEYEDGEQWADEDRRAHSMFRPWIVHPDVPLGWDEFDPFCTTSAERRSLPGKGFRAAACIAPRDAFRRSWFDSAGVEVMRAFAWGERRGYGEHETKAAATALLCETGRLLEHLAATGQSLAILVKIDRYRSEYSQDPVRFRSAGVLAVLGSDGRLVFSTPAAREKRSGDW